jgi:hypothetical protein
MATYKNVDSKTMLAAAESGQEGVRKAADRAQQEHQFTVDSTQRGLAQRNSEFQNQQQIDQGERQLNETVRRNRMGEAIQQDQQDIEMADKGLEASGPSRADSLRGEIDRGGEQQDQKAAGGGEAGGAAQGPQRSPEDQAADAQHAEQSAKPLEVAGPDQRSIAPTEQRKQLEGSKSVTNRMNAQANYLNAVRNMQQAKMKDGKESDSYKAEVKNLQQPIKEAARMFDAGKKGDLSDSQWTDIKDLASDVPDPAIQQEIASKTFGPALGRFLQARVSQSAIQFMAVTGDMPDGDLVDLASPAMRQFTQSAEQMQGYLKAADAGGLLSGALGIQSMADRNRMVRKLTAQAMLNSKATPKPSGGDLIPSQGGQRAIPAPGQQPGGPVNLTPGRSPLPPGAPDPNQRENSPVQGALRQREQRGVDEQQRGDERQRRLAARHPTESYTREGIRIPR